MSYYVSRQCQWPDGLLIVEVAAGGIDNSGPGAFESNYEGEGQEYNSPVEAVEAAINICRAWRKDKPETRPSVGVGCTLGGMFGIEPCTFGKAREWAIKGLEKLPKCDGCGEVLSKKERYQHEFNDSDVSFCSEYCCEQDYNTHIEYNELIEQEEGV